MPPKSQPVTQDHEFIWDAIRSGEFKLLKNLCPPNFNFQAIHWDNKITVLQKFLRHFIICSDEDLTNDYLEMAKWLMGKGADPTQLAASDSSYSADFWKTGRYFL